MDVVDKHTRSRMMAGIQGKDTKPEMLVRRALFGEGLRFRLHRKDLPGAPDIVLPGRRVAIFVHGCFWHQHRGCRLVKLPATNTKFWRAKLQGNVERDRRAIESLLATGWRVLTVWECTTRDPALGPKIGHLIREWMETDEPAGEIARVTYPDW